MLKNKKHNLLTFLIVGIFIISAFNCELTIQTQSESLYPQNNDSNESEYSIIIQNINGEIIDDKNIEESIRADFTKSGIIPHHEVIVIIYNNDNIKSKSGSQETCEGGHSWYTIVGPNAESCPWYNFHWACTLWRKQQQCRKCDRTQWIYWHSK